MRPVLRLFPLLLVCALAPAVLAQANLTLDTFSVVSPLAPGSLFGANADYKNTGPSPAADFKMTITIPPGVMYRGRSANPRFQCTEPPKGGQGDLVCTAASVGLVSFDTIEADLRVDPAATPGTVITIVATLTSSNAVKPSQSISKSLTVIPPANLHLELSAPASATVGNAFRTTITVTNQGPGTAINTIVNFTQSAHVSTGRLIGPSGWTCGIVCTNASFAPGTATITVSTTVPANSTLTSLTETASAGSPSDADYSDNFMAATVNVIPPPHADMALSVAADKNAVFTGERVTVTFTVTNNGPDSSAGATLQLTIPPGSTPSITSTFACATTPNFVCIAPPLDAGGVLTAAISFQAPAQPGLFHAGGNLSWTNSPTAGFTTAVTDLQVIAGDATRHRATRH